jgi:hypothetical protein
MYGRPATTNPFHADLKALLSFYKHKREKANAL